MEPVILRLFGDSFDYFQSVIVRVSVPMPRNCQSPKEPPPVAGCLKDMSFIRILPL